MARRNAIKDTALARKICAIVLKRMVSIYEKWHTELSIGPLMDEIRSVDSSSSAPNTQP